MSADGTAAAPTCPRVDEQLGALRATPAEQQNGTAGEAIGDRGQHQRPTKRCANADVLGRGCCTKDDGYERDDALREGSSKGGQHRADCILGNPQFAANPFDTVDEELAADVDQRRRAQQEQNRNEQLDDSSIAISASEIEGAGLPEFPRPPRSARKRRREGRKSGWTRTKRADGTRVVGPVC